MIDTTTHTVVGTGLDFTLASLAGGNNYDLQVSGAPMTPLGGIFAGAVHVAAAVPIPAAVWLLLSGLAGVGATLAAAPQERSAWLREICSQ